MLSEGGMLSGRVAEISFETPGTIFGILDSAGAMLSGCCGRDAVRSGIPLRNSARELNSEPAFWGSQNPDLWLSGGVRDACCQMIAGNEKDTAENKFSKIESDSMG